MVGSFFYCCAGQVSGELLRSRLETIIRAPAPDGLIDVKNCHDSPVALAEESGLLH
jgi:hypothetical protein